MMRAVYSACWPPDSPLLWRCVELVFRQEEGACDKAMLACLKCLSTIKVAMSENLANCFRFTR